jgi:hypothetical protein
MARVCEKPCAIRPARQLAAIAWQRELGVDADDSRRISSLKFPILFPHKRVLVVIRRT